MECHHSCNILNVSPKSDQCPASGTTTFTVPATLDWSVSDSSGWLTATKADSVTLTVSYDENISLDSRSAEITVYGQVTSGNIMVDQSSNPVLEITPESTSLSYTSGTTTFCVASNIDWS
jgi:hypothetical protein